MSRFKLSLVVVIVALAAHAPTAYAGPGDGSGVGSGGSDAGVIRARVSYETDGSAGESGDGDGCEWVLVDGSLSVSDVGTAEWPRTGASGQTFHLWRRTCGGGVGLFEFPEAEPEDLLPGLLNRLRERELPVPEPVFEALDRDHGWAYVRVPLDFRAGGGSWQAVSATASIGPLWATVTAQPVRLVFDPGDPAAPGSVVCGGDGPVAPYLADVPGECSYTYVNSSATSPVDGFHFLTSLSIEWEISWTSSTGAGGPLDGFTTSSSELLAVAEIQALVTCTGSRPEQGGC